MTKSYIKTNYAGTFYYKDKFCSIFHREDGPAIEYADGSKSWWQNGKRHREDGPALEYFSGVKYWYLNGIRHRVDGPACEYPNGTKIWYLNDKRCSEKEHEILTKRKNLINFL